MRRVHSSNGSYRVALSILAFAFIIGYVIFKLYSAYMSSLFQQGGDRINVVMYGETTAFYSLDRSAHRNYIMYFFSDLKMNVPGGYGEYRIGSLGKLAKLSHDPEMLKVAFSEATSTRVDRVITDSGENVYYGKNMPESPKKPSLQQIIWGKGNAGFFDRLYLATAFFYLKEDQFSILEYRERVSSLHKDDVIFQRNSFSKNSLGLLYHDTYRQEQKNVQIRYTKNFSAAEMIAQSLSGDGIRVNDITQNDVQVSRCTVTESTLTPSATAKDLVNYYQCIYSKGSTDVYDIVFTLNGELEHQWGIQ